jgi:hypothetical protein
VGETVEVVVVEAGAGVTAGAGLGAALPAANAIAKSEVKQTIFYNIIIIFLFE